MRPNILVLTPRYPYPVIGGDRLRIYEICRALAVGCDLTLLSLCETDEEMKVALPTDGIFVSIHRVFLPRWLSYLNTILAFVTGKPLQVGYYKSGEFQNELVRLMSNHDLVFAHLLRTGDYVRDAIIPSVVEMTDAISMNYARSKLLKKGSGFRSFIYSIETNRLKDYEVSAANHHSLLCFVSAIDAQYLYGKCLPKNVLVCGNGVDTKALKFLSKKKRSKNIAFIGNMVSLQNQDAALWFAREVLPHIRTFGDFRFRIIGKISNNIRVKFEVLPGVEVTGKVDSVADVVTDCFVGVCPVRIGAGIQNKLLEYMALGLPSVSTSIGLEGLGATDCKELYLANSPLEFTEKILHLWNDQQDAERIAYNARMYVETHHAWENVLSPLVMKVITLALENKTRKDLAKNNFPKSSWQP